MEHKNAGSENDVLVCQLSAARTEMLARWLYAWLDDVLVARSQQPLYDGCSVAMAVPRPCKGQRLSLRLGEPVEWSVSVEDASESYVAPRLFSYRKGTLCVCYTQQPWAQGIAYPVAGWILATDVKEGKEARSFAMSELHEAWLYVESKPRLLRWAPRNTCSPGGGQVQLRQVSDIYLHNATTVRVIVSDLPSGASALRLVSKTFQAILVLAPGFPSKPWIQAAIVAGRNHAIEDKSAELLPQPRPAALQSSSETPATSASPLSATAAATLHPESLPLSIRDTPHDSVEGDDAEWSLIDPEPLVLVSSGVATDQGAAAAALHAAGETRGEAPWAAAVGALSNRITRLEQQLTTLLQAKST